MPVIEKCAIGLGSWTIQIEINTQSPLLIKVQGESSFVVTTGNFPSVVTTWNQKLIRYKKCSLSVEMADFCFPWDSRYLYANHNFYQLNWSVLSFAPQLWASEVFKMLLGGKDLGCLAGAL